MINFKFNFKHLVACIFLLAASEVFANNLSVTNVDLGVRNPSSDTVTVEFDLSWDNSWNTKINHDAVWLTFRLFNPTNSPSNKVLCLVNQSGVNPGGSSVGTDNKLEIYVPNDRRGAFVRPAQFGQFATINSTDLQLTLDYSSCGFTDADTVRVQIFATEMVYIPESPFYAGDNAAASASLVQGSGDSDPWYVQFAGAISVTAATADGFYYRSGSLSGEDPSGAAFTIAANYPKGYSPFYMMKYEINEGQWVEFMNALPTDNARINRDVTSNFGKNSDQVVYRNTISCSGSPLTCSTTRPHRSLSYISWADLAAFLDWAALRPFTELEFEKAARGPVLAVDNEYAWGTTSLVAPAVITGSNEDGSETISNSLANANYNNVSFTGGDSAQGANHASGPLRGGIFAGNDSTREESGAAYYGVLDLSGNLREQIVTIGNATGRLFEGTHGDGVLTTTNGYEGNATNYDWPGMSVNLLQGVIGAAGTGYRGGAWDDATASRLETSDRALAAQPASVAAQYTGGRGVRTYDGN